MKNVLIATVAAFAILGSGAAFAGEKSKKTENIRDKQGVSSTFDNKQERRNFFGLKPLTDAQISRAFRDNANRN